MLLYGITILICLQYTIADIQIGRQDPTVELNKNLVTSAGHLHNVDSAFTVLHTDIMNMDPGTIHFNKETNAKLKVETTGVGLFDVYDRRSQSLRNRNFTVLTATVRKIAALDTVSIIVGWLYFALWTFSMFPQIYSNWKRKSVIGLDFDFLALNLTGHILYSTFNLGVYFIPLVKNEYFERYPGGQIPVKVNDIFFAVLGVLSTSTAIIQCCIYERGEQRVSYIACGMLGTFAIFVSISLILEACSVIIWLDFLLYCSYVKLVITTIKYVPQAYMNFKRKSTKGFSIITVLMLYIGGIFSLIQIFLDAYNYDDWDSILGDPTKFGLALLSVAFVTIFIIQHYILYRHSNSEKNDDQCKDV